jgi:hypothetical protein
MIKKNKRRFECNHSGNMKIQGHYWEQEVDSRYYLEYPCSKYHQHYWMGLGHHLEDVGTKPGHTCPHIHMKGTSTTYV